MNKKSNFSASILNLNAEKAQVFAVLFDQLPLNPFANQMSIQTGVGPSGTYRKHLQNFSKVLFASKSYVVFDLHEGSKDLAECQLLTGMSHHLAKEMNL